MPKQQAKRAQVTSLGYLLPAVLTIGIAIVFTAIFAVVSPVAPATPLALSAVRIDVADGHGSGVHIGHGLFVTAAHVAKEAKNGKLTVHASNGVDYKATVLWFNETYDVALLRVDDPTKLAVAAAPMRCGAPELSPGAVLTTVGNPLNLDDIHTYGYVARSTQSFPDSPRRAMIADLTIAPGNSGGPAFDKDGYLAGITVAMAAAPVGLSASLISLTYIVPTSAICMLTGRA